MYRPTEVYIPNGISIDSSVFAQLRLYPTHTDTNHAIRATSVAKGRIYAHSAC